MPDRLPDKLDSNARVEVRVNGVVVGTRRIIDFLGEITGTDDGTNDKVTLTVVSTDEGGDPIVNYWKVEDGDLLVDPDTTGDLSSILITTDIDGNNFVKTTDSASEIHGDDVYVTVVGGELVFNTNGGTISFLDPTLDSLLADLISAGTYGGAGVDMELQVNSKGRITGIVNHPSASDSLWTQHSGALTPATTPTTFTVTTVDGDMALTSDQFLDLASGYDIRIVAGDGLTLDAGAGEDIDIGATVTGGDIDIGAPAGGGGRIQLGFGGGGDTLLERDGGNIILSTGVSSGTGNIIASSAGTLDLDANSNITITLNGGTGDLIITGLPTASAGLPSGAVWSDSGTLKIIP